MGPLKNPNFAGKQSSNRCCLPFYTLGKRTGLGFIQIGKCTEVKSSSKRVHFQRLLSLGRNQSVAFPTAPAERNSFGIMAWCWVATAHQLKRLVSSASKGIASTTHNLLLKITIEGNLDRSAAKRAARRMTCVTAH